MNYSERQIIKAGMLGEINPKDIELLISILKEKTNIRCSECKFCDAAITETKFGILKHEYGFCLALNSDVNKSENKRISLRSTLSFCSEYAVNK